MPKAVAIKGDTKIETSTAKHPQDKAEIEGEVGSWVAGALQVTSGQSLSVGGDKVELKAEMTWTYVGGLADAANKTPLTPPGGPPIVETLTLEPGETRLKDNGNHVLVHGDVVTGSVDAANKIVVKVDQKKKKLFTD